MWNFAEEISLTERCDWSIGQCLQTSTEASTMLFTWLSKVYFQRESAYFQKKNYEIFISKKNFEINFQCERGLRTMMKVNERAREWLQMRRNTWTRFSWGRTTSLRLRPAAAWCRRRFPDGFCAAGSRARRVSADAARWCGHSSRWWRPVASTPKRAGAREAASASPPHATAFSPRSCTRHAVVWTIHTARCDRETFRLPPVVSKKDDSYTGRQATTVQRGTLLGPFYGAIAVPSVTRCRCRRCRCRGHRCAGGVWQWRRATAVSYTHLTLPTIYSV